MPRKNKNEYQQYRSEDLKAAVEAVRTKQMSVRVASKTYGIPRSAISDRITNRINDDAKNGQPPLIPPKVENAMVDKIMYAAGKGFGLSRAKVIKKAGEVCQSLNINNTILSQKPC